MQLSLITPFNVKWNVKVIHVLVDQTYRKRTPKTTDIYMLGQKNYAKKKSTEIILLCFVCSCNLLLQIPLLTTPGKHYLKTLFCAC